MAVKLIRQLSSDKSGDEIPQGKGATAQIKVGGKTYQADLTEKEATDLVKELNASEKKRRSRKPSEAAA